jgi:hypothetical protein
METYAIVPMDSKVATAVRETMKAPKYGFAAQREKAAGRAPCRHCLKLIRPQEEELILFTYDAFAGQGVPPLPGPVYIHAEECAKFSGSRIPEEYLGQPLTFEGFGAGRKRIAEISVSGEGEEAGLEGLFANEDVEYVHARSTSAGCYLFRAERLKSNGQTQTAARS